MKKNIIIILCILGVVALIGIRLASNKKKLNEQNKVVDRSLVKVPVTVTSAFEAGVSGTFILPAVVKPLNEVNISLNTSGKVKSLNFDLGTAVSKGQSLGSIDNSIKQISLESTQLLTDKYEKDYQRLKDLYEGKAATEIDFSNAKYNYENAKTQLAQIRQQIADGTLVSPIAGIVTKKNIEEGEFVNVGTVVATVVDIRELKAIVMVGERDVYKLKEGLPLKITSDVFPDKPFEGKIRFISPVGDDAHNYQVEITIENNAKLSLKGGTFIRVEFDIHEEGKTLQIPKLALVEGTKNPYVFVALGGKAVVKKLVLGRDLGENIEVVNGLNAGEQVITSGQINLSENSLVEIINSVK